MTPLCSNDVIHKNEILVNCILEKANIRIPQFIPVPHSSYLAFVRGMYSHSTLCLQKPLNFLCLIRIFYFLYVGLLEAGQCLKRRWLDRYKWLESDPPAVKSIPNKWHCHQEGQPMSPQSINICTGSLLGFKRMATWTDKGSSACS
ncbi:hypothetical protein TNCV_4877711 [Trichonephila clavipes]|nr:hypothetical protein TNCV_4877711 [Trichonephila clavipes]